VVRRVRRPRMLARAPARRGSGGPGARVERRRATPEFPEGRADAVRGAPGFQSYASIYFRQHVIEVAETGERFARCRGAAAYRFLRCACGCGVRLLFSRGLPFGVTRPRKDTPLARDRTAPSGGGGCLVSVR
jgi:hypothetical protein